jgi:hypothetical protein
VLFLCELTLTGRLDTCAPTHKNDHTFARCATRLSRAQTILHSMSTIILQPISAMLTMNRHRRTHEPRADGEPLSDYQDEDLEGDEDHLHSLEEDSPESGNDYLSLSHHGVSLSDIPGPTLGMTSMAPPQQLMAGSHY